MRRWPRVPGVVMRRFFMGFALVCVALVVPAALTAPAHAEIFIAINKSAQSMSVVLDGRERYRWPVSTGRDGGPPSGAYRPERLERTWYSRKYDGAATPKRVFSPQ